MVENRLHRDLKQFVDQKGGAKFREYQGSTIHKFVHFDWDKLLVIYQHAAIDHPGLRTLLRRLTFEDVSNYMPFIEDRKSLPEVFLSNYTFIPVLTLEPHHLHNLFYINELIDIALRRCLAKKTHLTSAGIAYRTTERALEGYYRWWDLPIPTLPTMEDRVERLGLSTKLRHFITRRMKN